MAEELKTGRAHRLARLREAMATLGVESFIVTDAMNYRYLSGFTGSNAILLISPDRALLFTDGRYWTQAEEQCPGWDVVHASRFLLPDLYQHVRELGVRRVGFEAPHVSYARWQDLNAGISPGELVPTFGVIERFRAIKDADEIATVERAARIADAALESALPAFDQSGTRERDISSRMETFISLAGADAWVGGLIVASGDRAAIPHWRASLKPIDPGDLIVIDYGCILDGYHSDATRTYAVGTPSDELRHIYDVVLEDYRTGLAVVKPGVTGHEVDAAARSVIEQAGYGPNFGHAVGHGIGLAIHEAPRLGAGSNDILEAGNLVTIEPGIYLAGKGGVRIEDLVLVTEDGGRSLNSLSTEYQQW